VPYARPCRRAVLAAVALAVSIPGAAAADPTPGAAEIGDRLFPGLGNGGYDVSRYALDLRYATSAPSQPLEGSATIVARATQDLSRFNLDFAGQGPGAVWVDDRPADFVRDGAELVVTPSRPIRASRRFRVRVADFSATPTAPDPGDPATTFFFSTPHGSATALQPAWARHLFPSNDHPRDKARFTFRLDVPSGLIAVANGVRTRRRAAGDRTIFRYAQRVPMATQLVQIAVGSYDVVRRGRHRGVDFRDLIAPTLTASLAPRLAVELAHLDWLEARVGRYPFRLYGSLVVDADIGFALETQTLSVFSRSWFERPQGVWDPVMLHELAHQWFGDDVALREWSDLWLSEGHATWYEFLYAEEKGFLAEDTAGFPFEEGYADLDEYMRAVYGLGDQWRSRYGPMARPASAETLFSNQVYAGGALVLYALREEIGAEAFARLQRAWTQENAGASASTADFIALASRVAGRDLTAFLEAWLFGTTTPPMPNHPDWTVLPPTSALGPAGHRAPR
jgi:aminopeptidase N